MEISYGFCIIIGILGGFIAGTLVSRQYWIQTYKYYTEEINRQYVYLLDKFGIYKNSTGYWELKKDDNIWVRRQKM